MRSARTAFGALTTRWRLLGESTLHHCWFCDAQGMGVQDLCQSCGNDLPVFGNGCRLCAEPLGVGSVCGRCLRGPPPWHALHVALRYELPVDHLIQRFKYNADASAGRLCGQLLARALPDLEDHLLVPVPMHTKRFLKRGFNPAAVLARDVARLSGQTYAPIARRVRYTEPQFALKAADRRRNVQGAFVVKQADKSLRPVLLVDDVYTTGETARALAKACLRAGYRNITVAAVARGGTRR